ncbi:multimodular transpeptidase-transglycosylase PbpC [Phenylobacterium montanum]|uniref:PBP1A family penicillin-binding protein n=1 Tax=Phenylobacterium montanum TaxID=2823693 RepID=A0A975ISU6_9CAUL|nr:PBP1A family penicillin-binding protein [Caulobacter sp. S6]QUD86103.1 PBP1A family penicillin-binding protein [Caulobacter sp. S6]
MTDWTPQPVDDDPPPPGPRPAAPQPRSFGGRGGPPKPKRKIAWGLLGVVAVAVLLILGAFAAAETWVVRELLPGIPEIPDRSALMAVNQTPGMTFEDANGAVIARRGARHGHAVTLAELPPYVPRAFLAVEDKRFYSHGPVDLRGVIRAAWINWRAHRTVQGGSTLTQQLAKTLFLTPDQTLKRKLQEAVIANRLEQLMTKDQVLELYLNRIFFGDNSYGLDAAAQTYFGKPASALSLQEAALLAALPKAPTRLALTNDMPAALARSHIVLDHMRDEGWITVAQEQVALNRPPRLAPEQPGEGDYGYVLDMAAAQAVQITGAQSPDLIVRLTIDPALQGQAQAIVKKTLAEQGPHAGASQGALVLIGPDGAVRALVGGTDHHASAFNRVTQAQRQPGSSFKPFVYATALEQGLKPTDVRQDAPVRFGTWAPSNYEGGYRGPVTLAEALAHSINTVAARVTSEIGAAKVADLAHRFGLKDIPADPNLSLALGTYEVNLLELTSGYQVFQQGGQRTEPFLVQQISNTGGQVLYARAPSAGLAVYDVANAAGMVRMLEGVIDHGTGVRAGFGRPAAGKTGTTSDYRDAWFVGFTPDWVCGVWVGNDDNSPMNHVTGGQLPADIWRQMMLAAHRDLPVRDFDWMPPPDAGEAGAQTVSDEPPSDAEPADEASRAEAGDQRKSFYGDLSNDFDQAAGGGEGRRRDAPQDQAPPLDRTAPREEQHP